MQHLNLSTNQFNNFENVSQSTKKEHLVLVETKTDKKTASVSFSWLAAIGLFVWAVAAQFYSGKSNAETNQVTESEQRQSINALIYSAYQAKDIDAWFDYRLADSSWMYIGNKYTLEGRLASIRLPEELALSQVQQAQYIQKEICPSSQQSQVWQQVSGELWVELVSKNQTTLVKTKCNAPA